MMEGNVFCNENFFQIRVSAYPIERIERVNCDNILQIFFEDEYFQKSIFDANRNLYRKIMLERQMETNDLSKVKRTLLNYYRRMVTRSTPFGMFAGVANGRIEKNINFNEDFLFHKNYMVNNEWIYALIKKLEKNLIFMEHCHILRNKNVYEKNDRLYLFYNSRLKEPDNLSLTSINLTEPIKNIFSLCETPISEHKLVEQMISLYGTDNENEIRKLITDLIGNNYLLTNINKANMRISDVINILGGNPYYKQDLEKLYELNEKIEKLNEDGKDSIENIEEIIRNMKCFVNIENVLQQNMSIKGLNATLDDRTIINIGEAVTWLWNNGCKAKYTDRLIYYSQFVNIYGENVKVPFTEVYLRLPLQNKSLKLENDLKKNDIIYRKIIESLFAGKHSVSLDNALCFSSSDDEEIPDMEIYGRLTKVNLERDKVSDDYRFILNNSMFNDTIGGTFGRFLNLDMDNPIKEELKDLYDTNSIGIKFNSKIDSWKNIMSQDNVIDQNILLNYYAEQQILIEDIFIVAYNFRFHIWSQKKNDYVNILKLDMFNPDYIPDILVMLLNLQRYNRSIVNLSVLTKLNELPFCPRLTYKNVVLKPMTWNISSRDNQMDLIELLHNKKVEYNIDRYVNFITLDQKLLVDTENMDDIKYLTKFIKKNGNITLEEIVDLKGSVIKKGNFSYMNEVVIPLKGKKMKNSIVPNKLIEFRYLPLEGVLYFELYINERDMDNFLINDAVVFLENIAERALFEKFFFIRYYDKYAHLRFRFIGNECKLLELIKMVNKWYSKLWNKRLVNGISYNVYTPEIARYGGIDYFDYVQDYFCYDSVFVIKLLKLLKKYKEEKPIIEIIIAFAFVVQLKSMKFKYNDFIRNINVNDKSNKGIFDYQKYKIFLFRYLNETYLGQLECSVINLVKEREENSKLYKLLNIGDNKVIYGIVDNLLHMTCNRITIVDKTFELRVRECLRCFFKDLKFWRELRW